MHRCLAEFASQPFTVAHGAFGHMEAFHTSADTEGTLLAKKFVTLLAIRSHHAVGLYPCPWRRFLFLWFWEDTRKFKANRTPIVTPCVSANRSQKPTRLANHGDSLPHIPTAQTPGGLRNPAWGYSLKVNLKTGHPSTYVVSLRFFAKQSTLEKWWWWPYSVFKGYYKYYIFFIIFVYLQTHFWVYVCPLIP